MIQIFRMLLLILLGVNLPWVSHPGESFDFYESYIKGNSNEIINYFFSLHSNLPGPLTNGLKYFRFWLRLREVIQIFPKNLKGYDTAGVNLPGISYCRESVLTLGVNRHILKLLHRPLKGQYHKNKCGFIFYRKGLHLAFLQKSTRIKNV